MSTVGIFGFNSKGLLTVEYSAARTDLIEKKAIC
jgi:hypothetical protein